jgi:carbonic anhydrase
MRDRYREGWRVLLASALVTMASVALIDARGFCLEAKPCNAARPSSSGAALQALLDGNTRWAAGKPTQIGNSLARRVCVTREGQTPYAAILSCSDSRVPPELIFDEGIGDLFVVRVAGNSLDKLGEQSLEYAADHLGVETIVVLGHSSCGAVKAAVDSYPASAPEFVAKIYDAIAKAKTIIKGRGENADDKNTLIKESTDQHVILEVLQLRSTQPFKQMIEAGKLTIVGARYDLDTGRVAMLIK